MRDEKVADGHVAVVCLMRVDADCTLILENDQGRDFPAECVAATAPTAAKDLADAVTVARVGDGQHRLSVERTLILRGDRARSKTFENFLLVFDRTFIDTVVKRMDQNADIFKRILDEPEFQQTVLDYYATRLYERLRAEHDQLGLPGAT